MYRIKNMNGNDHIQVEISYEQLDNIEFIYQIKLRNCLRVLDELISKIEFMSTLDLLISIEGDKAFRNILQADQIRYLIDRSKINSLDFHETTQIPFIDSHPMLGILKHSKPGNKTKNYLKTDAEWKTFPKLSQILDILYQNEDLRQIATILLPQVNPLISKVIQYCVKLKDICEEKLIITPIKQNSINLIMHKAYKSEIISKEAIRKMRHLLGKTRTTDRKELQERVQIMNDLEKRIAWLKIDNHLRIVQKISTSEHDMEIISKQRQSRVSELKEQLDRLHERYEKLIQVHLKTEKKIRAKKMKVESQLMSWLTKYDSDMGERDMEFQQIYTDYDEEKNELEQLQAKLHEQDQEYEVIIQYRARQELLMLKEKRERILHIQCARKIQRFWRSYRIRMEERRRMKKEANKKKNKKRK